MSKTIAVIDGNSLMHRAFHAVPPFMAAPDGRPTNAVFGFLSMLLKFAESEAPNGIICAFDAGRPQFRMDVLEQYKAQRPPMDPNLKSQFPLAEALCACLNIPVVKMPGWEGDDILGSLSAQIEAAGMDCVLLTGDKDAYQLASDRTRIATTKKGASELALYGPAEVEEKYGITVDQFVDYLGLMGDSADNIPGVKGVGPKTAAKLLVAYGSIEGIYEHLEDFKGKQLENLIAGKESAFISRDVARIVRDLKIDIQLDKVSFPAFSATEVESFFAELGFHAQLKRTLNLSQADSVESACAKLTLPPLLDNTQAQERLERALAEGELIAVHHYGATQLSLFESNFPLYCAVQDARFIFTGEEASAVLAQLVKSGQFVAHDVKTLLHRVYPKDSSQAALVTEQELLQAHYFDTCLAAYNLNSSQDTYKVEDLLETYAQIDMRDEKGSIAADAYPSALLILQDKLQASLIEAGSVEAYQNIDIPLLTVLLGMERTGAALDVPKLQELGASTTQEIEVLRAQVMQAAGHEFNLDSPKQLSSVLFEELGLPAKKKTKSGYSTNAAVLKELAEDHEICSDILRYRELAKINSTYIEALPRLIANDGLIHTSYNEMVTTTGRLSSSDPNLQNIPVRSDFGRKIRSCFIPLSNDDLFVSADYSQIELRLLAHLSQDEGLIAAFNSGYDFHLHTASTVFGVPLDQVTPQMRSKAKAVNFGIVYGQQAFGLSQALDIPFAEAQELIDQYFANYPQVKNYLNQTIADAHQRGYAETIFGRKRYIPELKSSNANLRSFGERTAMNHPMQGSAADIIKLAMITLQRKIIEEGLRARLMIQVHDELDLSVHKDDAEALAEIMRETMESVVDLHVPLLVDIQLALNWADAH